MAPTRRQGGEGRQRTRTLSDASDPVAEFRRVGRGGREEDEGDMRGEHDDDLGRERGGGRDAWAREGWGEARRKGGRAYLFPDDATLCVVDIVDFIEDHLSCAHIYIRQ